MIHCSLLVLNPLVVKPLGEALVTRSKIYSLLEVARYKDYSLLVAKFAPCSLEKLLVTFVTYAEKSKILTSPSLVATHNHPIWFEFSPPLYNSIMTQ